MNVQWEKCQKNKQNLERDMLMGWKNEPLILNISNLMPMCVYIIYLSSYSLHHYREFIQGDLFLNILNNSEMHPDSCG